MICSHFIELWGGNDECFSLSSIFLSYLWSSTVWTSDCIRLNPFSQLCFNRALQSKVPLTAGSAPTCHLICQHHPLWSGWWKDLSTLSFPLTLLLHQAVNLQPCRGETREHGLWHRPHDPVRLRSTQRQEVAGGQAEGLSVAQTLFYPSNSIYESTLPLKEWNYKPCWAEKPQLTVSFESMTHPSLDNLNV